MTDKNADRHAINELQSIQHINTFAEFSQQSLRPFQYKISFCGFFPCPHNLKHIILLQLLFTMYLGNLSPDMDPSWPQAYHQHVSQILMDGGKIVDDSAQLLTMVDASYGNQKTSCSAMELEPTPLGPKGVEKVVPSVTLSESNFLEQDILESILKPLPQYRGAGTKRTSPTRLSSSSSEPSLKKHRTTSWQNTSDATAEKNRLKQRASWTAPGNMRNAQFMLSFQQQMLSEGGDDYDEDDDESDERFRNYQSEHWVERFADLVKFRAENGHTFVPHNYEENAALAQWVKRQRYQYKLKQDGKHTTLTDQRQAQLEAMGFVWDSHKAIWEERYRVLCQFRMLHGHSNVPSNYPPDKSLAIWVKCKWLSCNVGGNSALS